MATANRSQKRAVNKTVKKAAPLKKVASQGRVTTATEVPLTTTEEWKASAKAGRTAHKLTLPSGKTALVQNPGMPYFIEQGLIPNALLPIVNDAVAKGKGVTKAKVQEVAADVNMLKDFVAMANNAVVACFVEPRVHHVPDPEDPAARMDDRLYTDEIELEDKMFVLQWVIGGTSDVEAFRTEAAALVGDVPAGEVVGSEAE